MGSVHSADHVVAATLAPPPDSLALHIVSGRPRRALRRASRCPPLVCGSRHAVHFWSPASIRSDSRRSRAKMCYTDATAEACTVRPEPGPLRCRPTATGRRRRRCFTVFASLPLHARDHTRSAIARHRRVQRGTGTSEVKAMRDDPARPTAATSPASAAAGRPYIPPCTAAGSCSAERRVGKAIASFDGVYADGAGGACRDRRRAHIHPDRWARGVRCDWESAHDTEHAEHERQRLCKGRPARPTAASMAIAVQGEVGGTPAQVGSPNVLLSRCDGRVRAAAKACRRHRDRAHVCEVRWLGCSQDGEMGATTTQGKVVIARTFDPGGRWARWLSCSWDRTHATNRVSPWTGALRLDETDGLSAESHRRHDSSGVSSQCAFSLRRTSTCWGEGASSPSCSHAYPREALAQLQPGRRGGRCLACYLTVTDECAWRPRCTAAIAVVHTFDPGRWARTASDAPCARRDGWLVRRGSPLPDTPRATWTTERHGTAWHPPVCDARPSRRGTLWTVSRRGSSTATLHDVYSQAELCTKGHVRNDRGLTTVASSTGPKEGAIHPITGPTSSLDAGTPLCAAICTNRAVRAARSASRSLVY
ncbi:hypothetical protein WOLCODRAFT_163187 [Wolfiporia cocos MD-104 SS10]|uniref:Uncharacterized protein n=1 Tax=Wolfiporia cocos (strain MD-104) TaxID=742152 RepID=A0A2H3JH70_WOLCO|nr:hypothetical protein WOLCODRAFT_163187 [Wolfiporia cocos MD-104 SS10]